MRVQMILFVSIALLIYFTLHALVFLLLRHFLFYPNRAAQAILAGILFFLALCFIAAFIGTHYQAHPLLKAFYYFSAVWLGTLVNLLLVFGVGALLFWVLKKFGLSWEPRSFGLLLLLFTGCYTAFGIIHAQQLKIRVFSLPLQRIPPAWEGKKITHISDVHLGIINGERLSRKIVAALEEQKPDLVFITGDLFDGIGDDLIQAVAPFNRLQVPIFYVTGNHETYLGLEKVLAVLAQSRMRVLRDQIIDWEGVQIVGIDYPLRGWKKDIRSILMGLDRSRPALLLYHEPVGIETARSFPIVLQLAGHTHNGQMWPMPFFTHLFYNGYDYGLHRLGEYVLYTTSGAGTWGPPMRIGTTAEVAIFKIHSFKPR